MNWYQKFASFRNEVLKLAKTISTKLFLDVINKINNKTMMPFQAIIDQNQEKELTTYAIKKIVIEIRETNSKQNAIDIDSDFIKELQIIKIDININPYYFGVKQREFMATEIKNIIGHEIGHSADLKANPDIPYSWDDNEPATLMDCII